MDSVEKADRTSLSSFGHAKLQVEPAGYNSLKSPLDENLEVGALREGGRPNIYSKEQVGILVHYFGAGMVYSVFYKLVYPFLNNYLRMSGVATSSASVLMSLPYTLRVIFGLVSDCFPIAGYRRRPYMLIGWALCAVCSVVMACLSIGEPYYPERKYATMNPKLLSADVLATFNRDAPDSGTKFVLLLILANLGVVMAGAASGGVLVELSQREPENVRGTLQTMIWVTRDLGNIAASVLVGFGLNSGDFGGSFDGSIGVNALMAICAVVSAITASAWFNITESGLNERLSMWKEIMRLFDLIQYKVVYYVLAFKFFKTLFANTSVTAAAPIRSTWAKQYGLSWNWRLIIITAQIAVVFIDVFPTFFTIWNVYRSQWFWLGVPLLQELPSTFSFIVSTFCMVEIMDKGNEAAFYGLVYTVSSLASPFSTVIYKQVDANFDIALADIQVDDTHVRTQVTYAYLFQYAMQLFSLVFVVFLPRQMAEIQQMKRDGSKSFAVGVITVVLLVFVFVWSVMTNLMSIFPSTSCLLIAGGKGC